MSTGTPVIGPEADAADAADTADAPGSSERAGDGVDDRAGDGGKPNQWNRRRVAKLAAAGIAIFCAIFVLMPVLAAPITADDRYWYVWTSSVSDGSFPKLIEWSWDRLPWRIEHGRLNVLTEVERRTAAYSLTEASVATSTPITFYLALLKALLLVGAIGTVLGLVRSLRWRAADGGLVRASRRTLTLVAVGATLAVATGVQAQVQSRNGWTAYPVSTYGAAISIFGSIALLLWLTRLVAEGSRRIAVVAVAVLVLLGVTTNFRYVLVFPAVPVAALALLIIPVTGRADRAAGRRAKLITGAAYFGSFIPVFIAIRLYLANVCSGGTCYSGVQSNLGMDAIRTTIYNFVSSAPGAGRSELRDELVDAGWADRYSFMPTWWSVLIGLGALGAMLILWWAVRDQSADP
ncbi:MAG: hypothetical protein L0Y54_23820, partial [Sporichthyaceae bacterium]|nr:hypothetical protein [Sporichthyaceae bacterium]